MKGKLIFLGTGGSLGVPMVGCTCAVCLSTDPLNKRLRSSVLIRLDQRQFLIDVGPDFRQQALKYAIDRLDGILLTHSHQDHVAGIDDLRPIYFRGESPLPFLLSPETAHDLRIRYHYLFPKEEEKVRSRFDFQLLPERGGTVMFENLPFQFVTYAQGGMPVNGYRLGSLAYLSDIRDFSPEIFNQLQGVKILVLSALRYSPSPLHLSVDEAIDFANKVGAEKVWLTHISHELEHHDANAYLPRHIRLAYDGLEIDFD